MSTMTKPTTDYRGALLFGAAPGGGIAFDTLPAPDRVPEIEPEPLPAPAPRTPIITGRLQPRAGQPVLLPAWMYQQ